jgi:chemotaxis protein CheD
MITPNEKRFFDPKFKAYSSVVLPGEFATTNQSDHMLVTVLGSCIAACIRDPDIQIGGVNHFLLAEPKSAHDTPVSNRYGCYAMECLINEIIKAGGRRDRLEIKLFGGASLFESSLNIGGKNSEFAINYLKREGFKIAACDVGGERPRRIHYFPSTGQVMRQMIQQQERVQLIKHEISYKNRVEIENNKGGDIELFD